MDLPIQVKYPGKAKQLLADLQNKKISLPDFLKECAYWALEENFESLIPLTLPNMPAKVQEYEGYDFATIRKLDRKFYDYFPEISEYYHKLCWVINKNKATLEWLQEIKRYIPSDDVSIQTKIDRHIQGFFAMVKAIKTTIDKFYKLRQGEDN